MDGKSWRRDDNASNGGASLARARGAGLRTYGSARPRSGNPAAAAPPFAPAAAPLRRGGGGRAAGAGRGAGGRGGGGVRGGGRVLNARGGHVRCQYYQTA